MSNQGARRRFIKYPRPPKRAGRCLKLMEFSFKSFAVGSCVIGSATVLGFLEGPAVPPVPRVVPVGKEWCFIQLEQVF